MWLYHDPSSNWDKCDRSLVLLTLCVNFLNFDSIDVVSSSIWLRMLHHYQYDLARTLWDHIKADLEMWSSDIVLRLRKMTDIIDIYGVRTFFHHYHWWSLPFSDLACHYPSQKNLSKVVRYRRRLKKSTILRSPTRVRSLLNRDPKKIFGTGR